MSQESLHIEVQIQSAEAAIPVEHSQPQEVQDTTLSEVPEKVVETSLPKGQFLPQTTRPRVLRK